MSRDRVVAMVLVCWERKAVAVSAADGELASAREVVEKRELKIKWRKQYMD